MVDRGGINGRFTVKLALSLSGTPRQRDVQQRDPAHTNGGEGETLESCTTLAAGVSVDKELPLLWLDFDMF